MRIYGEFDSIPNKLAEIAARYWYGDSGQYEENQEKTKYASDGGGYTLRGTKIYGGGESAIIYKDNGIVVEFYDGDCVRIKETEDGYEVINCYTGEGRKM